MSSFGLYPIQDGLFETCQHSIVALTRKLLTMEGGVERQVIGREWWRENRRGPPPAGFTYDKPVSIGRYSLVKIEYAAYSDGLDEHTILFVKNHHLQNGWSLFDADGIDGLLELFPDKGVLQLDISRVGTINDVAMVKQHYTELTPAESINTPQGYGEDLQAEREEGDDGDRYNLGFCGLFLFIFLCFYSRNKDNPNWPACWSSYLRKMQQPIIAMYYDEDNKERGTQQALRATYIAQEIYRIIQDDYSARNPTDSDVKQLVKRVNRILVKYLAEEDYCYEMADEYSDEDMDGGGGQRSPIRVTKKKSKKKTKSRGRGRAPRTCPSQIGSGPFLRLTEKEFFQLFDPAVYDDESDRERENHCVLCSLINLRTGVFRIDRHLYQYFKTITDGSDVGLAPLNILNLINTYENLILTDPNTRKLVTEGDSPYRPSVMRSVQIHDPIKAGLYASKLTYQDTSQILLPISPLSLQNAIVSLFKEIPKGYLTIGIYTKVSLDYREDGDYHPDDDPSKSGHSHALLFYRGAERGNLYMIETQGSSLGDKTEVYIGDKCCKIYTGIDILNFFRPLRIRQGDKQVYQYTKSISIFVYGLKYRRSSQRVNPELREWGDQEVVLERRHPVPTGKTLARQVSLSDDLPVGTTVIDFSSGKNRPARIKETKWSSEGVQYLLKYSQGPMELHPRTDIVPYYKNQTTVKIQVGDAQGQIGTIVKLLRQGNYKVTLSDSTETIICSGNHLTKSR